MFIYGVEHVWQQFTFFWTDLSNVILNHTWSSRWVKASWWPWCWHCSKILPWDLDLGSGSYRVSILTFTSYLPCGFLSWYMLLKWILRRSHGTYVCFVDAGLLFPSCLMTVELPTLYTVSNLPELWMTSVLCSAPILLMGGKNKGED